ncbi:hypothetical protein FRX31_029351 [Thalictrum thalictroides]|uniref:Uncharacterized protein n=1 Tax=Thalictrum thalictroides TaxID=46969 RepID=A0A7J6VA10_THATH|nr:hypothetical protein FRX31_029351 [Thalictrum thalictroides]
MPTLAMPINTNSIATCTLGCTAVIICTKPHQHGALAEGLRMVLTVAHTPALASYTPSVASMANALTSNIAGTLCEKNICEKR